IEGDLGAARACSDEALNLATDCGADHVLAKALHRRGQLARLQDDRYQAEASDHQALRLWDEIGQHVGVASSLEALGGLAADEGRTRRRPPSGARADQC